MKFRYRVRDEGGNVSEGDIEADNQGLALQLLKQQGASVVMSLNPVGAGGQEIISSKRSMTLFDKLQRIGTVPNKTIMVFFRQLATMVKAGLSLSMAIDILAEQEKSLIFRDILIDIKSKLDRGVPLSQAMLSHSLFNNMMTSLVAAGEEGGLLDDSLERVASLLEKQAALKSKIKSAMFYPVFVMVFAIAICVIFIAFIMPKFKQVFDGMKIELPALTKAMFAAGDYCTENAGQLTMITVIVLGIIIFIFTSKTLKPTVDKVKMKTPVIKALVFKSAMARATQTLAALVTAGVPILRGLEMAENIAGNVVISKGFADMQVTAKQGLPLGDSAKAAKIFPPLVCQMMRIGEETGHLDDMLERVASWYDQELDEQIKAMTSLIEPFMIVFVGGIVALIASAIFGPITSAISQLG